MNKPRLLLRNFLKPYAIQVRTLIKKPPLPEGGIKYYGFTYYPRHPNFKDPPYEPTKLFLIKRIVKNLKGLNCVEKSVLRGLNIDGQTRFMGHLNIVKNIPEINANLWKVKHLVKITPITFVNGLPKDNKFTGTYLRENGMFMVSDKVEIAPERIEAHEKLRSDESFFDRPTMRKFLMLRWVQGYEGDI